MPEYIGYTPTGTANSSVTRVVYNPFGLEAKSATVIPFSPIGDYKGVSNTSSNTLVTAFRDSSTTSVSASVGIFSGNTINFGTAVVTGDTGDWVHVESIANNKVLITYSDSGNSNFGTGIVGTVSGNSISFGTAAVFESVQSPYSCSAYIENNKAVIAYRDDGNSYYGTAVVATISGTSLSYGTPVVFESAQSDYISIEFIGSDKVVIAYSDEGTNNGYAVVGTVSGTSISFGTPVQFESGSTEFTSVTYIGNDKIVISYRDGGNSDAGTAVVGTISGTSISFGTPVVFVAATSAYINISYIGNNRVAITYRDGTNSGYATAIIGTVSGTSISFGTPKVYESASTEWIVSTVMGESNNNIASIYTDQGNSNYVTGARILIGANEDIVEKKYNTGIWSFEQVLQKRLAGTWPNTTRDDPPLKDLYYNSTSLILNFEGSNGATSTVDASPIGHTITFNGDAQISTAQAAVGSSSAVFDGTGDYLSIADDTSLQLSGDFTIEFAFRMISGADIQPLIYIQDAGHPQFIAQAFLWRSSGTVEFYSSSTGSSWDIASALGIASSLSTGTWYVIALTRSGSTYSYYLDGTRNGTFSNSSTPHSGYGTGIGARSDGANPSNVYIDQVRITKGVARYTGASYVVPTSLYPTS